MNRQPLLGAFAGLMLGFSGAFLVLQAVERGGPDPPNEIVVGNPDVNQHCQDMGDTFGAVLQTTDAFGWRCAGITSGTWETRTVDLSEVCAEQFGSGAYLTVRDSSDPTSWRCVVRE